MQTIQDIIDNMPADRLPIVLASLITPSAQEEVQRLLAIKPSKADLVTMSIRDKHELANTFQLSGFHCLIGQDLDDFLTEKLNLI
jgi:hypothetical protein